MVKEVGYEGEGREQGKGGRKECLSLWRHKEVKDRHGG